MIYLWFVSGDGKDEIEIQKAKKSYKKYFLKDFMKFDNKEQSPDYLKGIFETASEGILFADVNGHILRCNPSFYTLLGYEKD